MLYYCWASVADDGSTLKQLNIVLCFLGDALEPPICV